MTALEILLTVALLFTITGSTLVVAWAAGRFALRMLPEKTCLRCGGTGQSYDEMGTCHLGPCPDCNEYTEEETQRAQVP